MSMVEGLYMNKKIIIPIFIVGFIAAIVIIAFNNSKNPILKTESDKSKIQDQEVKNAPSGITLQDGNNIITSVTPGQIVDLTNSTDPIKEITMTSFTEFVDGKPRPQYSAREIIVNKGDRVRIKITVTGGMHNFNLDEFNIHIETPLNQKTLVEFVADKSGELIYYCSKPGHRQNGHWGILKVLNK